MSFANLVKFELPDIPNRFDDVSDEVILDGVVDHKFQLNVSGHICVAPFGNIRYETVF